LSGHFSFRANHLEDPVARFVAVTRYFLSGWHIKPKVLTFLFKGLNTLVNGAIANGTWLRPCMSHASFIYGMLIFFFSFTFMNYTLL
jgi:hypothetical protein